MYSDGIGVHWSNRLSFIFNKHLPAKPDCQIGHGMQVNPSRWHHVLPRIFLPFTDKSIIPRLGRQMPFGFYRWVALNFPAWFDFYG